MTNFSAKISLIHILYQNRLQLGLVIVAHKSSVSEKEAFHNGDARSSCFSHRRVRCSPQKEQLRVKSGDNEGPASDQCGNESRSVISQKSHADSRERCEKAENTKRQRRMVRQARSSPLFEYDIRYKINSYGIETGFSFFKEFFSNCLWYDKENMCKKKLTKETFKWKILFIVRISLHLFSKHTLEHIFLISTFLLSVDFFLIPHKKLIFCVRKSVS